MTVHTVLFGNSDDTAQLGEFLGQNTNAEVCADLAEVEEIVKNDIGSVGVVLDLQTADEHILRGVERLSRLSNAKMFAVLHSSDMALYNRLLETRVFLVLFAPVNLNLLLNRITAVFENEDVIRRGESLDLLTGLYGKRLFYRKAQSFAERNQGKKIWVVTCNVVGFKQLNASLGRTLCDRLLQSIARQVKRVCDAAGANYGRLDNDNFGAVCLQNAIDLDNVPHKVSLKNYLGVTFDFMLVYGVCEVAEFEKDIETYTEHSLAACAAAEHHKKAYMFFDAEIKRAAELKEFVVKNYRQAFDENQFAVFYQPVIALNSDKVVACEALVRWIHPIRGIIPPDIFIPVFEENGAILELDHYVWRRACKDMRERIDTGTNHNVPISINMSRADFYSDNLVGELNAILAEYGIDHSLIRVEITESALQENDEKLCDVAKQLRQEGYVILMDDFGSGYSSLEGLGSLPIDILKLDMKFMRDLKSNGKTSAIVASILRMCKFLDLKVVAEGIETSEQREFLRGVGCEFGQGYLYSRPLPVDEFHASIEGKRLTETESMAVEQRSINLKTIWDVETNFSELFNSMVTTIGFYEYEEDNGPMIVRVNNAYFELLGGSTPTLYSDPNIVFRRDYLAEKDKYEALYRRCKQTNATCSDVFCRHKYDGTEFSGLVSVKYLGSISGREEYMFSIKDVTDEIQTRQRLADLRALIRKRRNA